MHTGEHRSSSNWVMRRQACEPPCVVQSASTVDKDRRHILEKLCLPIVCSKDLNVRLDLNSKFAEKKNPKRFIEKVGFFYYISGHKKAVEKGGRELKRAPLERAVEKGGRNSREKCSLERGVSPMHTSIVLLLSLSKIK